MPTLEITSSMLVNRGLGARAALDAAGFGGDTVEPDSRNVVDSFKQLVDGSFTVRDTALIGAIAAFTSPLELATYFINAKYAELGGSTGFLGTTASAVTATSGGTGFERRFQHGSIYWHAQVGAHELHGPIPVRWQELGGCNGFLGFPASDVTPGTDATASGSFAHFQGGSIYWKPLPQHGVLVSALASDAVATFATSASPAAAPTTGSPAAEAIGSATRTPNLMVATDRLRSATADAGPAIASADAIHAQPGTLTGNRIGVGAASVVAPSSAGAFEVHGAIRARYLALGAEASILGYPRTDETGTPDGVGRFNHFEGGSIYWTPGTTAHESHGLIRERWASLGWERNPQLGYPITDELIPDRRIGHRRPEVRKKPVLSLPSDVVKLPAEAITAGFPASVVNLPKVAEPAATPPSSIATALTAGASRSGASRISALGRLSAKSTPPETELAGATVASPNVSRTFDPGMVSAVLSSPASSPAEQRSDNRFQDFEGGVLFWLRGATAATTLSPLVATSDGTDLTFSGADIATVAMTRIGRASFEGSGVSLASTTFVGTTGYSFDGAQVHNRRHRLQLILGGVETSMVNGPFGISLPQSGPVTATVELQIEVWFDPSRRQIVLAPTDWTLIHAASGTYAATVSSVLRARLDPLLWTSYELQTLPDTDAGSPIAVLSAKTLSNGAVAVFVEPKGHLVLGTLGQIANAVVPSVVEFSQPD
jgi:hypothetical protein